MAAAVARIDAWAERELAAGGLLVAAERQEVTDRTASHRWYLRFKGDEKDFITVWFTLKQRTLHYEAQFMPAPETNQAEVVRLPPAPQRATSSACGSPSGPRTPSTWWAGCRRRQVDDDELDRIAGSSVLYTDDHFPTAMTLAHPSSYRRRPRRGLGTAAPRPALGIVGLVSSLAHRRRREDGRRPAGRTAPLRAGRPPATWPSLSRWPSAAHELESEYPGLRTVAAPEPGLLVDGGERITGAVLAVKPDAAEGACRALGVTGVTPAPLHRGRRPGPAAGGRPRRRAGRGAGHAQHPGPGRAPA